MRTKEAILADISAYELRVEQLKQELAEIEAGDLEKVAEEKNTDDVKQAESSASSRWPLPIGDYKRYGRQMIMPEIGLKGT